MLVLRALVSWLKEITFSIGLSHMNHEFHYQTSVTLRPISARVMGTNENSDELFFCHHKDTVHFKILKKRSNCELVLLLGNTENYM